MSDSLRPHGLKPTRLLHPWDSPGKSTIKYYSVLKRNEIMLFTATWVDLEIIMLSELSERDKYHMISLICGI